MTILLAIKLYWDIDLPLVIIIIKNCSAGTTAIPSWYHQISQKWSVLEDCKSRLRVTVKIVYTNNVVTIEVVEIVKS